MKISIFKQLLKTTDYTSFINEEGIKLFSSSRLRSLNLTPSIQEVVIILLDENCFSNLGIKTFGLFLNKSANFKAFSPLFRSQFHRRVPCQIHLLFLQSTPIFNGKNGEKKVAKNLNITTSLLIRKYKFGLCTFTAT